MRFWKLGLYRASAVAALTLFVSVEASAETLEDALVAAYNTNPTLMAERARLRATDETASQARAGWRPTVTLNSSVTSSQSRRQISTGFFGGSVSATNSILYSQQFSGSLTATQPLFRGGRTINATRSADAQVRAVRAQLWAAEQQVLLDTVTAYMDVIRDRATIDLNKHNVEVLQRELEASQDRFRVGEITRTDVAQSQARLSGSKSNLAISEAQLAESTSRYGVVIGQAPGNLEEPPGLPPLPSNIDEAIEVAAANNPNLISAQEAENAAKYDINQAKGVLLPSVDLQARYNVGNEIDQINSNSSSTTFSAQLTWPLYQAGAQYSRIRQAKQLHSRSRLLVTDAQRQVVQAATNAWEVLVSARATIVASEEQVRANEIAYEGVRQEARVGARTTVEVLNAEQELLDSRVALVRAKREEYVSAYQLVAAIGRLTGSGLGLPVELYDPEKNYKNVRRKLFGFGID